MKNIATLFILLTFTPDTNCTANELIENKVFGAQAEAIIIEGTVTNIVTKYSPYGDKYFYSVLYYGYTWQCEQAPRRTACYLSK